MHRYYNPRPFWPPPSSCHRVSIELKGYTRDHVHINTAVHRVRFRARRKNVRTAYAPDATTSVAVEFDECIDSIIPGPFRRNRGKTHTIDHREQFKNNTRDHTYTRYLFHTAAHRTPYKNSQQLRLLSAQRPVAAIYTTIDSYIIDSRIV